MANSPKVTIVMPTTLLGFYRAKAEKEGRSLSATLVRELQTAKGKKRKS